MESKVIVLNPMFKNLFIEKEQIIKTNEKGIYVRIGNLFLGINNKNYKSGKRADNEQDYHSINIKRDGMYKVNENVGLEDEKNYLEYEISGNLLIDYYFMKKKSN